MLLRNKFLIISSLILASCSSIPEKPVVELGVIDYPANEVIINQTGGSYITSVEDLKYEKLTAFATTTSPNRKPLAAYDKAIAFLPPMWELVQNYIHALERYSQGHCQ